MDPVQHTHCECDGPRLLCLTKHKNFTLSVTFEDLSVIRIFKKSSDDGAATYYGVNFSVASSRVNDCFTIHYEKQQWKDAIELFSSVVENKD